ncbi:hypothetical protein HELRODRAFT_174816 [Helobdella robusta]|uniref:Uncharacterized protein n=1 Tax=Helobdella robusta TaxID=6412 RepID=T1F8I4_HELRO|nr:hypothetical protein HELRODRAFT_174816 [Helobdella robusta]ESO01269.1 hypothetical protein HELRODRAFT_174816 [Helobdella robusta]
MHVTTDNIFVLAFVIFLTASDVIASVLPYLKSLNEETEEEKFQKAFDSLDYHANPFLKNINWVRKRDLNVESYSKSSSNIGTENKGNNITTMSVRSDDKNAKNNFESVGRNINFNVHSDKANTTKTTISATGNNLGEIISYAKTQPDIKKEKRNGLKLDNGFGTNMKKSSVGTRLVYRRFHDMFNAGEKEVLIEYLKFLEAEAGDEKNDDGGGGDEKIDDDDADDDKTGNQTTDVRDKRIEKNATKSTTSARSTTTTSTTTTTSDEDDWIYKLKESLYKMWQAHVNDPSPSKHTYKLKKNLQNNRLITDILTLSNLLLFAPHILYTDEEERLIFSTLDTLVTSFSQHNVDFSQSFLNELIRRFTDLHKKPRSFHLNRLNFDQLMSYPLDLINSVLIPIAQQLPNIDVASLAYQPALLRFDTEESFQLVEHFLSNNWPRQDVKTLASEYFTPLLERDGLILDELGDNFKKSIQEFGYDEMNYDKQVSEFIDILSNPSASHDFSYFSSVNTYREDISSKKQSLKPTARLLENILKSIEEVLFTGYDIQTVFNNYNDWFAQFNKPNSNNNNNNKQNSLPTNTDNTDERFDSDSIMESRRNYLKNKILNRHPGIKDNDDSTKNYNNNYNNNDVSITVKDANGEKFGGINGEKHGDVDENSNSGSKVLRLKLSQLKKFERLL